VRIFFVILAFVGIQVAAALFGLWATRAGAVAEALYVMTFLAILTSFVAAAGHRGRTRAWWLGCGVFASSYFLTTVLASGFWDLASQLLFVTTEAARPQLVTSFWLAWSYDHVGAPQIWTAGGTRVPALQLLNVSPNVIPRDLDLVAFNTFMQTGHCVITWLAGFVGGMVARHLYSYDAAEATKNQ